MTHFQYLVTGAGPPMTLTGSASDERAARREAILFLSGLLRDLAGADDLGSPISIEVRTPQGRLVCEARAGVSAADGS